MHKYALNFIFLTLCTTQIKSADQSTSNLICSGVLFAGTTILARAHINNQQFHRTSAKFKVNSGEENLYADFATNIASPSKNEKNQIFPYGSKPYHPKDLAGVVRYFEEHKGKKNTGSFAIFYSPELENAQEKMKGLLPASNVQQNLVSGEQANLQRYMRSHAGIQEIIKGVRQEITQYLPDQDNWLKKLIITRKGFDIFHIDYLSEPLQHYDQLLHGLATLVQPGPEFAALDESQRNTYHNSTKGLANNEQKKIVEISINKDTKIRQLQPGEFVFFLAHKSGALSTNLPAGAVHRAPKNHENQVRLHASFVKGVGSPQSQLLHKFCTIS